MTIVTCKKCGRQFAYELVGTVYPGGKEREEANCPYCGEVAHSEMTSQRIYCYKLNADGEAIKKDVY